MKKLFFFVAFVAMSMLSVAQVNQLVWANGRLLYASPMTNVDSLTYDAVAGMDTLLLPRVLIKEVHDTVYLTQVVHDTVYVNVPCGEEDDYNGHEYVDLGLPSGVKWATCNVGANAPEEYGDYFAWGETQTKSTYDWSTYKWCNGSYDTQTKYCTNNSYGTVDNKTLLEAEDDAAAVNWGGAWRMPTKAEQDELRNNCTWTWTTQNGVNGYKVTSKSNGNSIFLPAAGYRLDSSLDYAGSYGFYWASSLNKDRQNFAYSLDFGSGYVGMYGYGRYYGRSVRPVCQ